MTLYTVWGGEYSDRAMTAIFQSKEKAEKYVELHDKIDTFYAPHYICEYEFADDTITDNSEVKKYYYATISCRNNEYAKKGQIVTDSFWNDFIARLNPYIELDYDQLIPANYKDIIENKLYSDVDSVEEEYCVPTDNKIFDGTNGVIIETQVIPLINQEKRELNEITVFSTRSYAHARKVAVEQYQIYTQLMFETDGKLTEFRGNSLVFDKDDPYCWNQKKGK